MNALIENIIKNNNRVEHRCSHCKNVVDDDIKKYYKNNKSGILKCSNCGYNLVGIESLNKN